MKNKLDHIHSIRSTENSFWSAYLRLKFNYSCGKWKQSYKLDRSLDSRIIRRMILSRIAKQNDDSWFIFQRTSWAKMVISPAWRMKVDFPPMFGPVRRTKPAPASVPPSFTSFGIAFSPRHGWNPFTISKNGFKWYKKKKRKFESGRRKQVTL